MASRFLKTFSLTHYSNYSMHINTTAKAKDGLVRSALFSHLEVVSIEDVSELLRRELQELFRDNNLLTVINDVAELLPQEVAASLHNVYYVELIGYRRQLLQLSFVTETESNVPAKLARWSTLLHFKKKHGTRDDDDASFLGTSSHPHILTSSFLSLQSDLAEAWPISQCDNNHVYVNWVWGEWRHETRCWKLDFVPLQRVKRAGSRLHAAGGSLLSGVPSLVSFFSRSTRQDGN
ncbi:hypothetical protein EYF80_026020 [Liparis tanakae]|uniref:Uncharacterized protein n=1 Tax=Liparis tanakae TaxID=230148 RepID=A0A4Z2HD70_9TELE|nr:hypothetical protein EYF80_026020 [Liparis tanakae]